MTVNLRPSARQMEIEERRGIFSAIENPIEKEEREYASICAAIAGRKMHIAHLRNPTRITYKAEIVALKALLDQLKTTRYTMHLRLKNNHNISDDLRAKIEQIRAGYLAKETECRDEIDRLSDLNGCGCVIL